MSVRSFVRRSAALALTAVAATAVTAVTSPGQADAAPVQCQGQEATIVATARNETLQGTEGVDVIHTLGFDGVTVEAKGGNDVICSHAGHTARLYGEEGDDSVEDIAHDSGRPDWADTRLFDGPGSDHYRGTPDTVLSYEDAPAGVSIDAGVGTVVAGADTDTFVTMGVIQGSNHADTYLGSAGDDTYISGDWGAEPAGGDVIRAIGGNDRVFAFNGSIWLGAGDDTARNVVISSGVDSTVRGEGGNDRIELQAGGRAVGGAGDDRLNALWNLEEDDVHTRFRLAGGAGNDILSAPYAAEQGRVSCPDYCARGTLAGGSGTDTLLLEWRRAVVDLAAGRVSFISGKSTISSLEAVEGSQWDDVIRGNARANHLDGNGGDDVLVGRGGADRLHGGPGRDRADGGAGADQCRAETQTSC